MSILNSLALSGSEEKIILRSEEIMPNVSQNEAKSIQSAQKTSSIFPKKIKYVEEEAVDLDEHIARIRLNRGQFAKPVYSVTADLTEELESMGFGAIGHCLTQWNTGLRRKGEPGRLSNKEIATYLEASLHTLVDEIFRRVPLVVCWVYEAHYNGAPHIHDLLFIPIPYQNLFKRMLKNRMDRAKSKGKEAEQYELISEENVTWQGGLNLSYLFKTETSVNEKETDDSAEKINLAKHFRNTKLKYNENGEVEKRFNCGRIKDVQSKKELHFFCNEAMMRKYPNGLNDISNFISSLHDTWQNQFVRKEKKSKKTEYEIQSYEIATADYENAPKMIIDMERPLDMTKTPDKPKPRPCDISLRAKNGERYHLSKAGIYLTLDEIDEFKRACKNARTKEHLKARAERVLLSLVAKKRGYTLSGLPAISDTLDPNHPKWRIKQKNGKKILYLKASIYDIWEKYQEISERNFYDPEPGWVYCRSIIRQMFPKLVKKMYDFDKIIPIWENVDSFEKSATDAFFTSLDFLFSSDVALKSKYQQYEERIQTEIDSYRSSLYKARKNGANEQKIALAYALDEAKYFAKWLPFARLARKEHIVCEEFEKYAFIHHLSWAVAQFIKLEKQYQF